MNSKSTNSTNSKSANFKREENKMVKINMGEVSKLASRIYQAWISAHPEDRNRDCFNLALKEAYAELRIASIMPQSFEDFSKLDGETQYKLLSSRARLVPVLVMRTYHINANGEKQFVSTNRIKWMLRKKDGGKALESWKDSIDMIVSQAYIYISEKWEEYADRESFSEFLLRAVKYSAYKIGRSLEDKPSRTSKAFPSIDNPDFTQDITFNSRYYYPNTAEQAIAEAYVYSLAEDASDEMIIKGKLYGLTQKELASALNVSQPAIHKRLAKMRKKLECDKLVK